jgi:Leucine-rich repeat (LRR) protein
MSQDGAYEEAVRRIQQAEQEQSKRLSLAYMELESIPPEITQLTALTTLDLSGTGLTTLPPEINKLVSLTEQPF